ncbi:hypothetical protein [Vibrio campbellii]|uniref:hypothetical protein n=1 Tax=Vibrio campbellii TaxID=680 RepID=UPI00142D92F3|nr:hypothetical protein [Vibrio campbellii]NIY88122.1 hypothetical protein [Vibrio campbellii]
MKHPSEDVRVALAYNPSLSVQGSERLAHDDSLRVRASIASHTVLPESLQFQLAAEKHEFIDARLACNPNLTVELQDQLARSDSEDVRWMLAPNLSVNDSVLTLLAEDASYYIQQALHDRYHQ